MFTSNGLKNISSTKSAQLYQFGNAIDFGENGNSFQYLSGKGWGVASYGNTWTYRKKVELAEKLGHKIAANIDELRSFGPVDVFVMNSVLEHLQDVRYTMNLAKELLKPNGILIISVMDYRSKYIEKNVNRLRNKLPALSKNLNPIEHVNIYDYKSMVATLHKYNFKLISTGAVLYITDFLKIRNSLRLIKYFNKIESLSTKIIKGKELGIVVYALNS